METEIGRYDISMPRGLKFTMSNASVNFPNVKEANNANKTIAVGTQGTFLNVGSEESFIFTLEDGSTVTKSIRVISTTTSQSEA